MAGVLDLLFSSTFIIYPTLIFLVGNVVVFLLKDARPKGFPPGPRGLPVLGNLFQVDKIYPFLTYSEWAKKHDSDTPLGIKKGAINMVILNSNRLVRELFERRGAVYSDRPVQRMNNDWVFTEGLKAGFIAQNSSTWLTRWRKELNNNFGPATITKFRSVYEAETARLLVKLIESPTARQSGLEEILVCWMMSVPCLAVCGRRPDGMRDHGFDIKQFRQCSDGYAALCGPKSWDLFPFLRYLPRFFGIPEWKARARVVRKRVLDTGSQFLSAAKEQRAALDAGKSIAWESMLAKILREQRENDEHVLNSVADMGTPAFHIVSAAVNTSLAVFSIMLMILAKHPETQQRARDEVLEVTGGEMPKSTDVINLKYLEAFWNEVHRWRPVAPQAVAHAPSQDDVYNGYRIPKHTAVLINVWHINHSEEDFEEPEKFIPERFLQHPLGIQPSRANDPAHTEESNARVTYDFGAGRRICPGMHSAKQNLLLGLAKILWSFDILPPKGKEIDLSLETGFVQDLALHPKDFDVTLKLRSGCTTESIMEHYAQTYEEEAELMGWEDGLYQ